jgi:hypothetical protein
MIGNDTAAVDAAERAALSTLADAMASAEALPVTQAPRAVATEDAVLRASQGTAETVPVQIEGGSARGYQGLPPLLAIAATATKRAAKS